jgi:kynureninase
MVDRASAEDLDQKDPLIGFRDLFVINDDLIYMDGNSLGRLPKATIEAVRTLVEDEWGGDLVRGWHRWIELAGQIGDRIGAGLLGAEPGEVIISDSTSVNLYKLASGALDARPSRTRIVSESQNFPSDLYVLEGIAAHRGLVLDLDGEISESAALVCLSHVNYKSGELADMKRITEEAHDAGALVLWDLSHSLGAVPIDLKECGVDLAVGCTYKYLNAGPGAPSFLFVRKDLQEQLRQPIWGWFGHRDQFAMKPGYEPAEGISKFLVGTPPVISLKGVEIGVELVAKAGIERIREKSSQLTDLMIALFDEWLEPLGVELASPRDSSSRGAHIAFRHPEAWRICRALIETHGVIPDFREPDLIRYGPAPVYTRFVEVWDSMERLRQVVEARQFENFAQERLRVT